MSVTYTIAAATLIGPLAWEPPYAFTERQKDNKEKKKKKKKNMLGHFMTIPTVLQLSDQST